MEITPEFRARLLAVTAKRPATIIKHILKYGSITSEEIKSLYGYNHPPRAVRDVREQGIVIETFRTKDSDGRSIAAYRFGDPTKERNAISKKAGRTALSKALKKALIEQFGPKCFVYKEELDQTLLQVDHRIPYEIGGEQGSDIKHYMLLCPSANRAKSWSCEHCPNWDIKDPLYCEDCFWAHPERYTHIAGNAERRIILTFTGNEVEDYNALIENVGLNEAESYIKKLIKSSLENDLPL